MIETLHNAKRLGLRILQNLRHGVDRGGRHVVLVEHLHERRAIVAGNRVRQGRLQLRAVLHALHIGGESRIVGHGGQAQARSRAAGKAGRWLPQ